MPHENTCDGILGFLKTDICHPGIFLHIDLPLSKRSAVQFKTDISS